MELLRHSYGRYRLILDTILVVSAAYGAPAVGLALAPDVTTRLAVIIIYFLSGLKLPIRDLRRAAVNWRFLVLVQTMNLVLVPLAFLGAARVAQLSTLTPAMVRGLIVAGAQPVALQLTVVLTREAKGSEAAAVVNTALGNLLAVLSAPAFLKLALHNCEIDAKSLSLEFFAILVAPLLSGALLRALYRRWTQSRQIIALEIKPFLEKNDFFSTSLDDNNNGKSSSFAAAASGLQYACFLFLNFEFLCLLFDSDALRTSPREVLFVAFIEFALLLASMAFAWILLGYAFAEKPELRVAGLFAATQKNLQFGILLATALYGRQVNEAFIPLYIFFAIQLITGNVAAPFIADWVDDQHENINNNMPFFFLNRRRKQQKRPPNAATPLLLAYPHLAPIQTMV